jgi:NAD(P)-dependent dehydrogenase (short-subunit alcohol dehydrogenase family)
MTREMAVIYGKQNIRFNCLCPGSIKTPMFYTLTPEMISQRMVHIPGGRFGEPKEVAHAVAYLASDESSFVNGTTYLVDGGITQAYVTPE